MVLQDNLIAHWELNSDLSDAKNNGDLIATKPVEYLDGGVYLDGYCCLNTPTNILGSDVNSPYTIGVQVKNLVAMNVHSGLLLTGNGGSGVGALCTGIINNSSNTEWVLANGLGDSYSRTITIDSTNWTDVVYIYDGTKTKVFLNGVMASETNGNSKKNTPLVLGGYNNTGSYFGYTQGYFKNLVVYNDAVPVDKISKIFDYKEERKLTIHKTLKENLKQTVDAGTKQLHLTEDGGFYTYDKDGNLVQIGHDHENKDILEKLTLGTNGELLFDGKTIEVDVDLTEYMKISEYASAINQGSVAKADKALEIDGVKQAHPLMYYGTDNNGNIGFHYIPFDKTNSNGQMEQRVILNAKANETYTIDSVNDLSDGKVLVQAYKFVQGEQNVIRTIKEFNNSNSENFYYDKTNILFNDGCSIRNTFEVNVSQNGQIYKTNTINKAEFSEFKFV